MSQSIDRAGSPYRLRVDTSKFPSASVKVKLAGRELTVEGRDDEGEEDEDEKKKKDREECVGSAARAFSRKVTLPSDCDLSAVAADMGEDGVLTVTAPRRKNN